MSEAIPQRQDIKTKLWLPLVFAASTAAANETAPPPQVTSNYALTPSAMQIALQAANPVAEQIKPVEKPALTPGLKRDDRERLLETIKSGLGLGSWEYNDKYEGITRDLFTTELSFMDTKFNMKFQFIVARDGNGDIPAPPGMERLYRNDRPTMVGLQFAVPLDK